MTRTRVRVHMRFEVLPMGGTDHIAPSALVDVREAVVKMHAHLREVSGDLGRHLPSVETVDLGSFGVEPHVALVKRLRLRLGRWLLAVVGGEQ